MSTQADGQFEQTHAPVGPEHLRAGELDTGESGRAPPTPEPLAPDGTDEAHPFAKICFICTSSFTLATLYRGLFPFLRSRGYDVDVVTGDEEITVFGVEDFGALTPHVIPMRRLPHPVRDPVALWRLYRYIRATRPDILHVSTPKAALLGTIAGRLAGIRPIIFLHRRVVYQAMTGFRRWLFQRNDQLTCALAHVIIPVSKQIRDFMIDQKIAQPEKVRLLLSGGSNGVNTAKFSRNSVSTDALEILRAQLNIEPDVPVLAFVGRVCHEKGADELPSIMTEVRKSHPRAVMIVVGPDDARDPARPATLETFVRDPAFRRVGYSSDPRPYFALATAFVFPSYFEGIANVLLEAAAMECPSVGYRVPGVEETIVHGETGYLVEAHDVEAAAAAVVTLLRDRELKLTMGRQGRALVLSRFSNQGIWAALDEALRQSWDHAEAHRQKG